MTTTAQINEGDRVLCKRGNIDKDRGAGRVGIAEGFARFSKYHGREVFVRFGTQTWGDGADPDDGWFWLNDVQPVTSE